ncbi:MAG: hypothetical protein Q8R43_02450 [Alphaproteobacteria bacterium]|nr:hypothetical protein [Alphaproteobacteria bacterium]
MLKYIVVFLFFQLSFVSVSAHESEGLVEHRTNFSADYQYNIYNDDNPERKTIGPMQKLTNLFNSSNIDNVISCPFFLLQDTLSKNYIHTQDTYPILVRSAFILSVVCSLTGVCILGVLAYDFSDNIGAGPYLGWPLSFLSPLSPLLGFSAVSFPWFKSILLLPFRGLQATELKVKTVIKESSILVPSIITTLPLSFIAYDHIHLRLGDLAYIFAIATSLSFYFYYHKTTTKIYELVVSFYKNNINRPLLNSTQHVNTNSKKQLDTFFISETNQMKEYINNIPDSSIESAHSYIMHIRGQELKNLLGLTNHMGDIPTKERLPLLRKEVVVGCIGSLVGILGSFYFYSIAKHFYEPLIIEKMAGAHMTSFLVVSSAGLTLFCRGIFSAVSCFDVWKNFYVTPKAELFTMSGVCMLFLSVVGAIPSSEIALEYVGHNTFGYFITGITAITVFSEVYWGLILHKKRFHSTSIGEYRNKLNEYIQNLRSSIVNTNLSKLQEIYPKWEEYKSAQPST